MQNVLILGAGMTGLATAWKLLQSPSDSRIILIERDTVPGGLAKSIPWNGFHLDLGPHRFHTEISEIKDFINTFCEACMLRVPRHSRMYINGQYIPYPISPLKTFKALGLAQTLSFAASAFGVLLKGGAKNSASYEDYVVDYYGRSLYESIFKPFAEKVWGIPPSRIAAEAARVRLRGDSIWHALKDSLSSSEETYVAEFLYPPNGIGQIAQQFAQEVEARGGKILYRHTVKKVHHQNGKICDVVLESPQGEQVLECDILVNTLPLPGFTAMLEPEPPQEVLASAQSLHYRALVLLYLLFDREYPIKDTWLYYPEEHVPFTRISVPGNFVPTRDKTGQTCFCLEFTCEIDDTIWNAEINELSSQAVRIMQKSGLVDREPVDALAIHIRDGYPVYHVEYEQSLNTVLNFLRGRQNCLTVGRQGLFRHNNIDQAIQMGLHAANHIQQNQQNFQPWYDSVDRYKDYRIVD